MIDSALAARCLRMLLLASLLFGSAAQAQPAGPRFLTGPRGGDPLEIALDHVFGRERGRSASARAAAPDAEDFSVASRYTSARSGSTHIVLRQRIAGLDVLGGDVSVHVSRNGEVMAVHDRFASAQARAQLPLQPTRSASEALGVAAETLGLAPPGSAPLTGPGSDNEYRFAGGALSRASIPVRLRYWRHEDGRLHLVWNLQVETHDRAHYYDFAVDALSGELLEQSDWMRHDSYRVFAPPLQSPDDGDRTLEQDASDATASPFGWHDTNGVSGPEFLDTRGNNVEAQEDADANNSGGFRPSGGTFLDFDFALDLQASPATQRSAALTNLFYWSNWLHDLHYAYGFDEAAGNFQTNQYGNGGLGLDAVQVDAQDGLGVNNAQFLTQPDGFEGRMEMFLFTPFPGELQVNLPASIAAPYPAGVAEFGPVLGQLGISGEVVAASDTVEFDGTSTDACSPITNPTQVAGRIALVDRGLCLFVDKVNNVQAAGAIGAVVANNQGNSIVEVMGGTDPGITIPSLFVSWSNGNLIRQALGEGVNVAMRESDPSWLRDSAFDNTLIAHEYGHGVLMRRTGGPSAVNCLDNAQAAGMGEGWSDFWAIVLTANAAETRADPRAIATYVNGEPPFGSGFRNYQFSPDLAVNPQTYADITSTNRPHGIGEIWAMALWEVYWNLVDAHGFDPDLIHGTGGNNLALQLVMDGLALQPCEPSFLDARDAILLADQALTGGANECPIYTGFAKRGMGLSAADGGTSASVLVTEGFDVPLACPEPSAASLAAAALTILTLLRTRRRH